VKTSSSSSANISETLLETEKISSLGTTGTEDDSFPGRLTIAGLVEESTFDMGTLVAPGGTYGPAGMTLF